ncbi:MAG: S8 family serine peptidase [Pirellulaceae bacterium]
MSTMLQTRHGLRRGSKRSSRTKVGQPRQRNRRTLAAERCEDRTLLAAAGEAAFAPGEILVSFEGAVAAMYRMEGPSKALQAVTEHLSGIGLQQGEALVHRPGSPLQQERLLTLWKLPPGKDVSQAVAELAQSPGVAYAEPNYLVSIATTPIYPNDPKFSNLWGMHNTGQSGGTVDADIDAPEAWELHTGSGNVVVAVIDTGVSYTHNDLIANMWTNPFETPGDGIDNDNNGFVDDIHGADFVNNDGNPSDDNGHGTHVSGTIGGVGNNATGVVGVNWDVQIMALKFLDNRGRGTTDDAIRALNYATQMRQNGVNVVLTSNSWHVAASQALSDAIAASGDVGMLFVAAAGNYGSSSAVYPARYDLDNIISVAATDHSDQLASFSNWGTGVDIAAPGVDIYSTHGNTYRTLSGTSMATPHVSGAAALVADYLAANGVTSDYRTVRDCLFESGDRIAATLNTVSTGSRLNVHRALLCGAALAGNATELSVGDTSVVEGHTGTTLIGLTVTRSGITDTQTEFDWTTDDGTATAGSDYVSASGHVVFLPGETNKEIFVATQGDTAIEPIETFQVAISNVTNRSGTSDVHLYVPSDPATVVIQNDDFGLVSWWTADGASNDEVSGNHATLVSGATYATGQLGQAFSFDGVDDRALVADAESLKLTNSMTIEGWVRVDSVSTTSSGQILFRGDDRGGLDPYALSVETNRTIRFLVTPITNQGVTISAPVPVGQFFHVAASLDDATGEMRLYLNSVLVSHTVTAVRPFRDLDPLRNPAIGIGNHGGYPTTPHNFPFHGLIDDLKVYNYALSAEDVLANFNAGKGDLQPTVSVNDVTVTEGDNHLGVIDAFVDGLGGGSLPNAMTWGPEGDLYVAYQGTEDVWRYDGATGALKGVFVPAGSGGLDGPRGMAFGPDGKLYVVSTERSSVLRYQGPNDPSPGDYVDTFVMAGSGGLDVPYRAVFGPDGNLYVTSIGTDNILRFQGPGGEAPGQFINAFVQAGSDGPVDPSGLTFGPDGNLYVVTRGTDDSVRRYQGLSGASPGQFIDSFVPTTGVLDDSHDLTFGPDGNLYVTSGITRSVVRYQGPAGSNPGQFIDSLEQAVSGGLDTPRALSFGADSNLYVVSKATNEVLRYGLFFEAIFTVSLAAPFPQTVSVDYATADDSTSGHPADAGSDYGASAGTLVLEPGVTSMAVRVPILDDTLVEDPESFLLTLTGATNATIADGQGVGTIVDNDTPPARLSINDVSMNEGRRGNTVFTFAVTRSGNTAGSVTVSYATADGTALAGSDYTAASGTLTFADGVTSQVINVNVQGDRTAEEHETFVVNLSNVVGGEILDGQGVGTIVNDDGAALMAAFGQRSHGQAVTLEQVHHLLPWAVSSWSTSSHAPLPAALTVELDGLPAGQLGAAFGHTITLGLDANGAGWHTSLTAPAAGLVDLLSVLSHELGHVLGYDHSDVTDNLMAATLPAGIRRLPPLEPIADAPLLPRETRLDGTRHGPTVHPDPVSAADGHTGADADLWLIPLDSAHAVARSRVSFQAERARILAAVADEQTELLDEELLDLIAVGLR